MGVKVILDYGEEVQWLRILREQSNMTIYKMGSSSAKAYTMAKTFPAEYSKHGWKNDMVATMATLLAMGVLWRSSILGNLKPSDQQPSLQSTPTWGFSFFICLFYLLFLHRVRHTNNWLKQPCLGLKFLT